MKNSFRFGTIVWFLFFWVPAAWGQTITVSGAVTDNNGQAISQTVQVRAWQWANNVLVNGEIYTGWRITHSTYVNTAGAYSLVLPAGTYKMDARVGVTTLVAPCSTDPNAATRRPWCRYPAYSGTIATGRFWLEERWARAGLGDAFLGHQEAASTLTLVAGQAPVTEYNFRLGLASATNGRIRSATGVFTAGYLVRMETVNDFRRHHNSVTLSNPLGATDRLGVFSVRGLSPTVIHRLVIHDPSGNHVTLVHPTSVNTVAGTDHPYGTITLAAMSTDPYVTNSTVATAKNVGAWNFDTADWTTTADSSFPARIIRNSGRPNWFCWFVQPEERFIVTASTLNTVPGLTGRYHPWMDPILRVSNRASPTNPAPGTAINRYSGPGPLDAQVDTGRITVSGEYCAVVSGAGDTNFNGNSQYVGGPYSLRIAMGNRPPSLRVEHGVTVNPASVSIGEGDSISLGVFYSDPEGDAISRGYTFTRDGAAVGGSAFPNNATSGTWSWTAPNPGAGTYVVRFNVSDGEFSTSRAVNINVGAVNFPPSTPVPYRPEDGATVGVRRPNISSHTSTDPDTPLANLLYHFEVYTSDPSGGGAPAYELTASHPASGDVMVTPPADLPEKREAWWRVIADDQDVTGNNLSQWSAFRRFLVHAERPELEVYFEDQLVAGPLEVDEGGTLLLDLSFRAPFGPIPSLSHTMVDVHGNLVDNTDLLVVNSGVAGEGAAEFSWTAGALDSQNSPYQIQFSVFDGLYTTAATVDLDVLYFNLPPTAPVLVSPEDGASVPSRYPIIVAENATDPEAAELTLHFDVALDSGFTNLVAQSAVGGVAQDAGGETAWDVPVGLEWGNTYYVRVHARDSEDLAGPFSATHGFFVLPRTAPVMVAPANDASVSSRWPTLTAENAFDPAGDPLFMAFQVASDAAFGTIVASNDLPGEPQDDSGLTSWLVDTALLWNGTYYARARAIDSDGLAGPLSNVHTFTIEPRTAPVIVEPLAGTTVSSRKPTIIASNAMDPDGMPLFLAFEIASDVGFTNIVAQNSLPGEPQSDSGQTSWLVEPSLTFGETYYVRAQGIDSDNLAGPHSDTVQFSVRANTAPSSSTLGGPFSAQCTGAVVTENPLVVPITHGSDPDGDPVQLHLQVYRHGTDPQTAVDIDRLVSVDAGGDVTEVSLDIGILPDNTRFTIRVRSYDGIDYSSWHTCDFWNNTRNTAPTAIEIIIPEEGTILPLNTTEVTVEVQNAFDPDSVVPGSSLQIAWCASLDENFGDCPPSVSDWSSVPQSSLDPADTTEFVVDGITNRLALYIQACAMDETGVCGPSDSTWVVADGADQTAPTGCCSSTTSPSGDPWLALFAIFALSMLAPRRRRGIG